MEDTLAVCPKCDGTGRVEPDENGYDGCDLCNYGDGPTGYVPDYVEEAQTQGTAECRRVRPKHSVA